MAAKTVEVGYSIVFKYLFPKLQTALSTVWQQTCYGCVHSRDSQLDHDVCLMMDLEDRVDYYVVDALRLVDLKHVTRLCKLHLKYMYFDAQFKGLATLVSKDWIRDIVINDKGQFKAQFMEYIN